MRYGQSVSIRFIVHDTSSFLKFNYVWHALRIIHVYMLLICKLLSNNVNCTVIVLFLVFDGRREIADWESRGILTKACVSFSRDSSSPEAPRYVQDNIRRYGSQLSDLICDHNAVVSNNVVNYFS